MFNPSAPHQAQFGVKCKEQFDDEALAGPLRVELYFIFPRPQTHFDGYGVLLPTAPTYYTQVADIDNLMKFALDAMIGVVYIDDAQVMEVRAVKRYSEDNAGRTTIVVETLEDL